MLEQAFAQYEKPGALCHLTHPMEPIIQILTYLRGMCDSSPVACRFCSLTLPEKTFVFKGIEISPIRSGWSGLIKGGHSGAEPDQLSE
jgi:hypothetical protein